MQSRGLSRVFYSTTVQKHQFSDTQPSSWSSSLSPPDTSTAEHHFRFGPTTSFFLELLVTALCPSPGRLPTRGAHLPVSYIFALSLLFMGFSRQEYWSELPFPPPVDHVLSDVFTVTHPSWVALLGTAHSFIELSKPLHRDCDP